eukprot:5236870-Alexandrium_andersonii.AAC.1
MVEAASGLAWRVGSALRDSGPCGLAPSGAPEGARRPGRSRGLMGATADESQRFLRFPALAGEVAAPSSPSRGAAS